jgi:hypothetical protein
LQALHLRIGFSSLSPAVGPFSWDFSYHTANVTADITDVSDLVTFVTTQINTAAGGMVHPLSYYLSSVISRVTTNHRWEVYDVTLHLDGRPAGSPVLLGSWTMGGVAGSGGSPEAVSAVATLQAPYGTDVEFAPGSRPRARDRGRIYIGPLGTTFALGQDTSNRAIIQPAFAADITKFIKNVNVHTTVPNSIPYNLCVWSRKNAAMKALQEVWVDDRPDYRHQRAGKNTSKLVLGLP